MILIKEMNKYWEREKKQLKNRKKKEVSELIDRERERKKDTKMTKQQLKKQQ